MIEEKNRTAVEYLELVLIPDPKTKEDFEHNKKCFVVAKEMVKNQIKIAYYFGYQDRANSKESKPNQADEYYEEIYGGNK
jgi:hypothetical protein